MLTVAIIISFIIYIRNGDVIKEINLLRFGTFDVSNMSLSVLMSKIIFMKYLPPARPNFVPKIKNVQN